MKCWQGSLRTLIASTLLVHGVARAQGEPVEFAQTMSMSMSNPLSHANEVEPALSAGPEHLHAEATVYVFGTDSYVRIKASSSLARCLLNRAGLQTGDQTLGPTSWDAEGGAAWSSPD